MIRSTLCTLTKQTMGRVRRRTSAKQRSITLVVRSFRHRWRGKLKNDSSSGKSRSSCRTMRGYSRFQARRKARNASCAAGPAVGLIDGLGIPLDRVVIALAHLLRDIAHFVYPAAVMQYSGIDRLEPAQPSVTINSKFLTSF